MFEFLKKEPRELKDIETKEVSIVKSPANRKKFLFFKGEKALNSVERLFQDLGMNGLLEVDEFEIVKTALEALNGLDDSVTDAMADLLQVVTQNDEVQKHCGAFWPSLNCTVQKTEVNTEGYNWPSLA